MAASSVQMEELTSGASGRIIHLFRNIRRRSLLSYQSLHRLFIFIQSFFLWFLLLLPRRNRSSSSSSSLSKRKLGGGFRKRDEEDTLRRRALAEGLEMGFHQNDDGGFVGKTFLFYGVRMNALFSRSWVPLSPPGQDIKGIIIIIHGLNEHSGRYAHFARQLTSCNFGVYAIDWIGHGGSDGLHGYVPSLDHVVADTGTFVEKIKSEYPSTPCFLFGHSTGGAVVLKAASYPHIESMLEGIILTSPALRVKPSHPIVGDLYNEAASPFKDIKLYDGFLHDLLFEPEREEIGQDIISWMEKRLQASQTLETANLW